MPDTKIEDEIRVAWMFKSRLAIYREWPFFLDLLDYLEEKSFDTVHVTVYPQIYTIFFRFASVPKRFYKKVMRPWIMRWHKENRGGEPTCRPTVSYVNDTSTLMMFMLPRELETCERQHRDLKRVYGLIEGEQK
jgi:hypothetical protein